MFSMKSALAIGVSSVLASGALCQNASGSPCTDPFPPPKPHFNFSVSAFRAKCMSRGMYCNFNFSVAVIGRETDEPVTCSVELPSVAQILPPVHWTYCSDKDAYWGFTPIAPPGGNASDFALILADEDLGLVGTKVWGVEDFPVLEGKTGAYREYLGPTDFKV